jgi:nicotinamidase-related amidase
MDQCHLGIIQRVMVLLVSLIGAGVIMIAEDSLIIHSRGGAGATVPGEKVGIVQFDESWHPTQTAIIICDMWDRHWCKGATGRVMEMAPVLDEFVSRARERGVLVVHAPSGCMDFYKNHPARQRAMDAPAAAGFPKSMGKWCEKIDSEDSSQYPLDQSDGGCDDQPPCPQSQPWRRQIESISIQDNDVISDEGREIWNLFEQRRIQNVILVGVHLNMCVLGRPFGLRNLKRAGKKVRLCRDLTDTMYNSRARPFISHFEGTRRMIAYVEKFVCPSMVSTDLTGKSAFHFAGDVF